MVEETFSHISKNQIFGKFPKCYFWAILVSAISARQTDLVTTATDVTFKEYTFLSYCLDIGHTNPVDIFCFRQYHQIYEIRIKSVLSN